MECVWAVYRMQTQIYSIVSSHTCHVVRPIFAHNAWEKHPNSQLIFAFSDSKQNSILSIWTERRAREQSITRWERKLVGKKNRIYAGEIFEILFIKSLENPRTNSLQITQKPIYTKPTNEFTVNIYRYHGNRLSDKQILCDWKWVFCSVTVQWAWVWSLQSTRSGGKAKGVCCVRAVSTQTVRFTVAPWCFQINCYVVLWRGIMRLRHGIVIG